MKTDFSKLKDKRVVITGASSGLGRAIAASFASEGSRVALLARASERLESAAAEMQSLGAADILALPVDVSKMEEVAEAAEKIVDKWGGIDIWINNAMVNVFCFSWEISAQEFHRVTEVTYLGQVHGAMAALSHMRPQDKGKIIFIGSALSYRGIPLQSAYCGAKRAIQGFFESLRTELRHEKSRIDVSILHLPAMNTPQFTWVKNCTDHPARPMQKIYQPAVMAKAVKFLALNRRREMWVGYPTYLSFLGSMLAPGVAEWLLSKIGVRGQQTKQAKPSGIPYNLWEASSGISGSRGPFNQRASHRSLTLYLSMYKWPVLLFIGLMILIWILL